MGDRWINDWMNGWNGWIIVTGENQSAWRNTRSSVTLPTTNPRWTSLGLNLGLCGERPKPWHTWRLVLIFQKWDIFKHQLAGNRTAFYQPIRQRSTQAYSKFNFTFMHWGPQQRVGGMFVCEERLLKSHHTKVQKNNIKYEKIFLTFQSRWCYRCHKCWAVP
jgi:hypothetical protein